MEELIQHVASFEEVAASAAVEGTYAKKTPFKPIRVVKSDGNIALATTNADWNDIDTGGTAAARPLDLILPASREAQVGDWVAVEIQCISTSTAVGQYIDAYTIVSSARRNRLGGAATYIPNWQLHSNVVGKIFGPWSYQLAANDFEANGDVRFRFVSYPTAAGVARSLASAAPFQLVLEVKGPFE